MLSMTGEGNHPYLYIYVYVYVYSTLHPIGFRVQGLDGWIWLRGVAQTGVRLLGATGHARGLWMTGAF